LVGAVGGIIASLTLLPLYWVAGLWDAAFSTELVYWIAANARYAVAATALIGVPIAIGNYVLQLREQAHAAGYQQATADYRRKYDAA
jgi:hypothetical protein